MGLMDLSPIGEEIIGLRGSGLSTEQRKRVTIAVEIVANPVRGRSFCLSLSSETFFKRLLPHDSRHLCRNMYVSLLCPSGVAVSG
jgi:hypothetical protein